MSFHKTHMDYHTCHKSNWVHTKGIRHTLRYGKKTMPVRTNSRSSRDATLARIRQSVVVLAEPDDADHSVQFSFKKLGSVSVGPSLATPGVDTGNGIFALRDFQQGDVITEYVGTTMPAYTSHLNEQTHDASIPYSSKVIRGDRDTRCPEGVAQLSNDARDARNNGQLQLINNRLYLVATENIKKRDDIFHSYGNQFWNSFLIQRERHKEADRLI